MRWIRVVPQHGDTRVRKGFLWFPRTVYYLGSNTFETRWLERAVWIERYYAWSGVWRREAWVDFMEEQHGNSAVART